MATMDCGLERIPESDLRRMMNWRPKNIFLTECFHFLIEPRGRSLYIYGVLECRRQAKKRKEGRHEEERSRAGHVSEQVERNFTSPRIRSAPSMCGVCIVFPVTKSFLFSTCFIVGREMIHATLAELGYSVDGSTRHKKYV